MKSKAFIDLKKKNVVKDYKNYHLKVKKFVYNFNENF